MATYGRRLRRGLPRIPGADPWPPSGDAPAVAALPRAAEDPPVVADQAPAAAPPPTRRAGLPTSAPSAEPAPDPVPGRAGRIAYPRLSGRAIAAAAALVVAGVAAVLVARWLVTSSWGADFLTAYPGEYDPPVGAPVGFPAWLGWQHFFSTFLMVLIVRSGLGVRTEKRPTAFWSRRGSKRKISLTLWFHQSLDILWLANGLVFVVLLFVTGQWTRIVPMSPEVLPNALSAALQYVSLQWPTENGWVNYNALQQLAYFITVFVAAPLAVVTGVRMSGLWPPGATALNRAYPVEWARALHFPVMLYFVLFTIVHVILVFATGALRNLNHMYAARGSLDPNAYRDDWTGFWLFVASLAVIAVAGLLARPVILAAIARLFGRVSAR